MIARIHKNLENKDQGFTLIELLVVMIIIGILAAIAIPLFLTQRKKAEDTAAKADVEQLANEIATYWVDGDGPLPTVQGDGSKYYLGAVATANIIGNQSDNVVIATVSGTTAIDWCVTVTNAQGDKAVTGFSYSAANGLEEGATC